jgi:hypothetical protein
MRERQERENDSRAWALFLTEKGEAALVDIQGPLDQINERLSTAVGSKSGPWRSRIQFRFESKAMRLRSSAISTLESA